MNFLPDSAEIFQSGFNHAVLTQHIDDIAAAYPGLAIHVHQEKRLSAIVQQQIKWRDLTLLAEFSGLRAEQDYYIADKSLVLYYHLYEIMAYVFGFPYFPISVYEIADIAAEDGPLGRMMY